MTEVRGLSLSPVVLPEVRREAGVELRKARLEDVDAIYWLIRYWAEKGLMLVRSHSHLYENIRDFWVLEDEDGQIVGTVALHVLWRDLAEIRGLADGGAFGSIMGRNSFQRRKTEAIELLHEVMDIYMSA